MVELFKDMISTVLEDALLPTGKNLVPTIVFAGLTLVLNLLFKLFRFPTLMSTGGCVLALLVLGVLIVTERSEYSAISRLYRDVELRIKDFKSRQQTGGACNENDGGIDMSNKCEEYDD